MLRLFFILSFILPSILYAGDVQDFYSLRKTLLESKNNEKRIEAAQRLANEYPLKESLNILEAALEIELNKIHEGKKPGFSKVIAYNEAVKAIATSGNRELVERLIQKMKDGQESISRLHSPSSFEKMIAPLKEALESLREGELQNFNEFFGIEAQTVSIPKTSLSTSEISEALKSKRKQSFNTINSQLSSRDAGVITGGTSTFINDSIVERMLNNPTFSIYGRDAESEKLIKTLLRIKGPHPLLLGPSGAGKTAIVEKIAELIARDEIPDNPLYKQELEGVHILETTPARLKMLGKKSLGVELYFDALSRGVENGFKFIVFIDEIHNLDKEQKEAMKRYLSGENGIKLIGATTSEEWQLSTKDNEAFQRRFREIGVQELNKEQTFEILSKSWRPRVEDYYKVSISDETLKIVIQNAKRVHKEGGLIDATINVMQDLSIDSIPLVESTEKTPLTVEMVYKFFNKQLGFPVDPLNAKALNEYINGLNQKLEKKVINQDRMIKTVTGEWKKLLKDQQRKVRVVLMLGPTGVGKTRLAEKFTEITFDNPKAMLEINGNEYKEGANEARTLLGAPPGVVSSKERSGSLMDFLDDPGKGKNGGVLLINEFEKMHEEIRQMMMEFFDKGRITGKDGKLREANNLMILLTSNRGDEVIYPDGIEKWSESDISSYLAKYDKEKLKNLFLQNTGENDTFRMTNPEVQRIDAIVPANPLSEKMADDIAKLVSNELGQNLERDLGIKVSFSDELIHYLAMQQYSMVDGARNMERFVKDNLSDAIDASIEKLSLERGSEIELTLKTEAKKYFIAYESNSKKGAFSLPEAKISEPFENPKTLRIIGRLEGGELEKYVFGQEEALKV
jgi:ATP-dependent Clp protease ATP-binding subunit ClpC